MGQNSRMMAVTAGAAKRAQRTGLVLAMSLGSISPKRRMRNVRRTVCRRKSATGERLAKSALRAKEVSTMMVTFTRLLAMRIVASRRSGMSSRRRIESERSPSSSSSACCGVIEKNAISLPLTKADTLRAKAAQQRATIWATPKTAVSGAACISIIRDGKGSIYNFSNC